MTTYATISQPTFTVSIAPANGLGETTLVTLDGIPGRGWACKAVEVKTLGAKCIGAGRDSMMRNLVRTASGQVFACGVVSVTR